MRPSALEKGLLGLHQRRHHHLAEQARSVRRRLAAIVDGPGGAQDLVGG